MPVLTSVQHTGSHSALALFEPHFQRHALTEESRTRWPLYFGHCDAHWIPLIRDLVLENGPLVLLMRNPRDVIRSWRKRDQEIDHHFRQMYDNLFALADGDDVYWLPVDVPDRADYALALGQRLGVVFDDEFPHKGIYSGKELGKPARGMSDDLALEWLSQFNTTFERFGYPI